MSWETCELRLCEHIHDRKGIAAAEGGDYEAFQGFVAAVHAFCEQGIVEDVLPRTENSTGRRYVAKISWKVPASIVATGLSIKQRRWIVLRFFAVKCRERQHELFMPTEDQFAGVAGNQSDIRRACEWLKERDLIRWSPSMNGAGTGEILDAGYEALEHGTAALSSTNVAPPVQHIDQRNQSINIGALNSTGGDVAIGPGAAINKEVLADELQKLITAIQQGPGSEDDKRTALGHLNAALSHPLVASIAGGLASGLIGLL